ncbi:unnamed protein product [Eruca vesicaria subsp. sativa]|uniref:Uncharacterized protein n=1 Tax=Eruca vesicaria subsp. sativa TaxID=29727 RepID=A0ABC8JA84_ERUVS|nr:unnamed protein product [Eruca vesicaria subsp. sativa]
MDEKELDQTRKIIKELMKALEATGMAREAVAVESYLKTKIKNIREEKGDNIRKVNKELEMDQLASQLRNGERSHADLSLTENEDFLQYTEERIACLKILRDVLQRHPDDANEPILGDDDDNIAKASAPEGGGSKSGGGGGADDDA